MKRMTSTGQQRILAEHLGRFKRSDFCNFEKPRNRAYQKKRLNPTSKARREASRNKFLKKSGMPDRVKTLRDIKSCKNRPRARLGFVKSIRNGQKKIKNLI